MLGATGGSVARGGRPDGDARRPRGGPDRCDGPAAPSPARLAAEGPRAQGRRAEYELLVEAIYEGYLLHYGSPRVVRPAEEDLRLLAGDRMYAIGLAQLVALGDTAAVAELADTITLSALAQGAGAARSWPRRCGSPAHTPSDGDPATRTRRAKDLAFAGAPEAIEAMRTSVAEVRLSALIAASILFGVGVRQARKAQVQVHARSANPGSLRGRDGDAPALHGRHAPTARARWQRPPLRCPRWALRSGRSSKARPTTGKRSAPSTSSPKTTTSRWWSRCTPGIGQAGKSTVYIRKRNPAIDTDRYDRNTRYIAITSRCAHLGCPVRWVDAAERFICPCHGGVYNLLGVPVGGPPVRPLDRFYTRVIGEEVQVGPRFSVNSELKHFSPRDPGEPIDGLGQYLYPSRPSTRK